MRSYAGVGARATPSNILSIMEGVGVCNALGKNKNNQVLQLRSGGAQGADSAFEKGCDSINGPKQIFRPQDKIPKWCYEMVTEYCTEAPLSRMKPFVQNLLARNMMQILGPNGDDPVKYVMLWVPGPDACASGMGGTRYAARCAADHNIPILNLYNNELRRRVKATTEKFYETFM